MVDRLPGPFFENLYRDTKYFTLRLLGRNSAFLPAAATGDTTPLSLRYTPPLPPPATPLPPPNTTTPLFPSPLPPPSTPLVPTLPLPTYPLKRYNHSLTAMHIHSLRHQLQLRHLRGTFLSRFLVPVTRVNVRSYSSARSLQSHLWNRTFSCFWCSRLWAHSDRRICIRGK